MIAPTHLILDDCLWEAVYRSLNDFVFLGVDHIGQVGYCELAQYVKLNYKGAWGHHNAMYYQRLEYALASAATHCDIRLNDQFHDEWVIYRKIL